MKKKQHSHFLTQFFIAALGVVVLSSCGNKPAESEPVAQERPVRVIILEGGSGDVVKSYPGKTEAKDTVDLSFEVAGKIVELPVQRGAPVKKGDIVAKLDAQDYENDLAAKNSEYERALTELNRYRDLYEKDAVSRQELENKERNLDVAQANRNIAQKKVDDSILKAPFDGVVAVRFVENFQSIQAKEPVATIQNNEAIEVIIYMPERDLAVMQSATLKVARATFDTYPEQPFELKLEEYETQADPVTQTFKVKFTLPRPENINVLPGMSASVTVEFERKEGQPASSVFLLPSTAVQADPSGGSFVWVVDQEQKTVKKQTVQMGEVAGTGSVQIKDGLQPGMMIVTAGVRELTEGMKVIPKTEDQKITE